MLLRRLLPIITASYRGRTSGSWWKDDSEFVSTKDGNDFNERARTSFRGRMPRTSELVAVVPTQDAAALYACPLPDSAVQYSSKGSGDHPAIAPTTPGRRDAADEPRRRPGERCHRERQMRLQLAGKCRFDRRRHESEHLATGIRPRRAPYPGPLTLGIAARSAVTCCPPPCSAALQSACTALKATDTFEEYQQHDRPCSRSGGACETG